MFFWYCMLPYPWILKLFWWLEGALASCYTVDFACLATSETVKKNCWRTTFFSISSTVTDKTSATGKTNYTGVASRSNLQKACNEWLLPLRSLVSGIIAQNKDEYDQLAVDIVCAFNPVELVLYRCIELVEEEKLKQLPWFLPSVLPMKMHEFNYEWQDILGDGRLPAFLLVFV